MLLSELDIVYVTQKAIKAQPLSSHLLDIVYVTQKAIKAQALSNHLAENLVYEVYEPLKTYFPKEEVSFVG